MTREQAKSELMQIYMSLSEEKKKALDVAFKAMEQAIPEMYYPQVDGITPTVVAQADGEYIKKSDMIDWLKDIRHRMKPQNYHTASEFEIAENQIWNLIQMLQMGAFPSVAIPSAEPKTGHWIADVDKWGDVVTTINGYRCDKCNAFNSDKDNYCPNCGCAMVEPQESEDKE